MKKKKVFWLPALLGLIILFGAWFRMSGIVTQSFAFTYDVGRDLLAVRDIVIHQKPLLIGQTTGLGGLFYGPWWYYLLIVPYVLSQGNPQGIVLFIAILGLATIVLAYFLGKRVGGVFLGLSYAVLFSFSPYMINVSSQIWNPNIAPFFVLLTLLLLERLLLKKKFPSVGMVLLIGFLLGIISDAQIVFGVLFILGILLFLILFYRNVLFFRPFLLLAIGFFITLLPRILFEFRHDFVMTKSLLLGESVQSEIAPVTLTVITDRLFLFFQLFSDTLANGNKVMGIVILILMVAVFIWKYPLLKNPIKQFVWFSIIMIGVFVTVIVFFPRPVYGHFLIALPVFYLLLVGLWMYVIYNHVSSLFGIGVLFIVALSLFNPVKVYGDLTQPLWEGDAAVYRNQLAVVDYIYKEARGKQFTYILYTPAVHDFTYQYHFLWHGKNTYGYSPSQKKQDLFFLILEPDYQNPRRLQDWLAERKGDGKIIKNEKIKGGISVQTRVH